MSFVTDLDMPVLRLTEGDVFTLREACAGGTHVFGATGSGKTSGPGRMLAGALLRSGAGGIVTAVKPGEIELWKRYAAEHGRSSSLIIFDETEGFNFLSYEMARHGLDGIGSVTDCLMRIMDAARQASGNGGGTGGEPFWIDETRTVLRYSIPPLYAASGSLSISDIIRFVSTAPKNANEPKDAAWQKRSFMYSVMNTAAREPKVPMSREAMKNCLLFWEEEFATIPEKTLGNVVVTIAATLDRFRHGRLAKVFCGKTTIVPELTFHGSVIILAMPTVTWAEDGIIGQQLFKYLWQRAVLGRNSLAQKHRERLVFLYSDEAQETASGGGGGGDGGPDGQFLGLCRDSFSCAVYLTQSLPTYYAKMPRDAAQALVGKFTNHLYCANACPETNEYAARMIGKVVKRRKNYSRGMSHTHSIGTSEGTSENTSRSISNSDSQSGGGPSSSSSTSFSFSSGVTRGTTEGESTGRSETDGYSESLEYIIEPGQFARDLQNGGKANNYEVTGVWLQNARRFEKTSANLFLGRFKQQ